MTLFTFCGVFCAIYAGLSCRWFLIDDSNDVSANTTSAISIGIFRYQVSSSGVDNDNVQCIPYNPLFLWKTHSWFFTAQICIVTASVLAICALVFAMIGVNKNPTAFFLFMSTGTQTACVASSLNWCDKLRDCPWLLGELFNALAACFFLISWIVAMCGIVKVDHVPRKPNDHEDRGSQYSTTAKIGSSVHHGEKPIDLESLPEHRRRFYS
jgi:hypothetical protein